MSEPHTDISIDALLARPANSIEPTGVRRLQESLLAGAMVLAEVQAYEEALNMDDPAEGHAMILAREEEPAFEMIRVAVLATLAEWMKRSREAEVGEVRDLGREVTDEIHAHIELDRMREAAFRRDPGRFLPGATNSPVALFDAQGCWLVERAGDPHPWLVTHAALRYAQADLNDAYEKAVRNGRFHLLVIGAPGLRDRLALPIDGAITDTLVEVLEIDAADLTGPAAPTGGRAA